MDWIGCGFVLIFLTIHPRIFLFLLTTNITFIYLYLRQNPHPNENQLVAWCRLHQLLHFSFSHLPPPLPFVNRLRFSLSFCNPKLGVLYSQLINFQTTIYYYLPLLLLLLTHPFFHSFRLALF